MAYQKFNDGVMDDYIPTDEELERPTITLEFCPPNPKAFDMA